MNILIKIDELVYLVFLFNKSPTKILEMVHSAIHPDVFQILAITT